MQKGKRMYNGKVTFKRENKSVFKFRSLPGIKEFSKCGKILYMPRDKAIIL